MLANGASVRLPAAGDPLGLHELLAVATTGGLRDRGRNDTIWLAAPLDAAALEEAAPQLLRSHTHVFWAPGAKAVVGRRQRCIGEIILEVGANLLYTPEGGCHYCGASKRSSRVVKALQGSHMSCPLLI